MQVFPTKAHCKARMSFVRAVEEHFCLMQPTYETEIKKSFTKMKSV